MWYVYVEPIVFPFVASVLSLSGSVKLSRYSSSVCSFLSVVFSVYLLFMPSIHYGELYVDGLSKIMMITISFVYFTSVLFSFTYLKHVKKPLLSESSYLFFLNLFALTMLFSVIVDNLGLIWVGIEATTITSALLVAIDNDEPSVESSWRYIIIVSTGLVMSLAGIMFIYASFGTLSVYRILTLKPLHPTLFSLGGALAIAGFSTKAGIFPMHTWLPDVHGRAIAPVSAIFSGVLLPVALFGAYRVIELSGYQIRMFAFVLGVLTVAFAAVFLVAQRFYKRVFAYSSMENMGMILIGFAVGGKFAFLGAVVLLVAHAFAKSSAFYTTGSILAVYNTRDVNKVRALAKLMPLNAYNLVLSSLAVGGAPPFGTFAGEMLILYGIYREAGIVITLVVAFFLALAFFSVNYKVSKMCFSVENGSVPLVEDGRMALFVPLMNTSLAFLVIFAVGLINNILSSGVIR